MLTNLSNLSSENRLPELLVSVRNAAEARLAKSAGVDWIDLKEPRAGALGAVSYPTALQVIATLGSGNSLSAALGEWTDLGETEKLLELPEIKTFKIGLAGGLERRDWGARFQCLSQKLSARGKSLVAVAYADAANAGAPTPHEVLQQAELAECGYFLVDTYDKTRGGLLDYLEGDRLLDLLAAAQRAGLKTVVAGKITQDKLFHLPRRGIGILAVRGAVCEGDRQNHVTTHQILSFRQAMVDRWSAGSPTEANTISKPYLCSKSGIEPMFP